MLVGEHGPAKTVTADLVFEYEFPNPLWKPLALPRPFRPGRLEIVRVGRLSRLDRVRRSTQVMFGDVTVVVEEVSAAEVDGRAAQSFMLQQEKPADLWCANRGACFKLLPTMPMDVIAARTPTGMLWLTAEYAPEHRDRARSQFRELVDSIVLS